MEKKSKYDRESAALKNSRKKGGSRKRSSRSTKRGSSRRSKW